MEKWYCFKDKVEMVETEVTLSYMDTKQPIKGLKCPKCGVAYLTEETAEQMSKAEQQLEAK